MAASQQGIIRVRAGFERRGGGPGSQCDFAKTADLVCADNGPLSNRESPAALISRAVAASYAEALGEVLDEMRLPWRDLEVQAEAACSRAPPSPSLESVTVFPAVFEGDPGLHSDYVRAALRARDRSLVGHVVRGNVAYKVGTVTVVASNRRDSRTSHTSVHEGSGSVLNGSRHDLLSRHLLAFNQHLSDELVATLQSDCLVTDTARGHCCLGQTAVDAYYQGWWDALDLRVTSHHCYRSNTNMAAVEARCIGVHRGIFRGIGPTYRPIDLRASAILEIRNGLIAEIRIYYDSESLLRQLDVTTTDVINIL